MKLKTKFQDEDFDLGEVVDVAIGTNNNGVFTLQCSAAKGGLHTFYYKSLKELYDNWEDYDDTQDSWCISYIGKPQQYKCYITGEDVELCKQIGNKFETEEDAEKAVEKLKAITRLNKCGFRFEGYADRDRANGGDIVIYAHIDIPNNNLLEEAQPAMLKDLDLLFGGEEERILNENK